MKQKIKFIPKLFTNTIFDMPPTGYSALVKTPFIRKGSKASSNSK